MTQSYSELKSHIDQLWKIIEQQDAQIQELKKTNNNLCNERDDLQEKLRLVLSIETETPNTSSTLDKQTSREHDPTESGDVIETSSPNISNPVLPARSPYRSFNASDADVTTFKDRKHQLSSTSSLSVSPVTTKSTQTTPTSNTIGSTDDINTTYMSSQEPISPKIIQQDAKLFAQYQSAVSKRDMTSHTNTNSNSINTDNAPFNTPLGQRQYPTASSPIVLVPSKSSTLPSQSHKYRLAQRKQHSSMVFPPSTVIPVASRNKKDDQQAPPPTPPPHRYQQPRRQPTTNMRQQHQQQHNDSSHQTALSSNMALNSMSDVTVKVVGSLLKSNDKGKDVVSFILSVGKHTGDRFEELWRVQKLYSDFLDLDLKLKAQLGSSKMIKTTRLPEKQLFTTRSPNKLDQRRVALEKYLHHVIALPMDNISDFCEFLSTDVVDHSNYMNQGNKEGYLTKRGKNFGGWKTRYFVLKKNRLDYYETKDGSKLGSILLDDAQIGRQTPPNHPGASDDSSESVYRHAILILEYRRASIGNYVRHILCASSDTDCDEWITALLQVIQSNSETSNHYNEATSPTSSSVPSLGRSNSTTNRDKQRNKKQSPSDKQRKLFKGEIRTVSATPISHLRLDSSQAVDMEKLTMAPANNDIISSPSTVHPTPSDSSDSGNGTISTNTTTTPSSSLPLSSPLSMSSADSPCTPRQQYQYSSFGTSPDKYNHIAGLNYQQQQHHRPSLTKTDSLEDSMVSPQSRPTSPIPAALFDRRESDDSIINGAHDQQQDKKMKTKSANRMTLWGKKVFGNQQRSLSSPTSPNGSSGTDGLHTMTAALSSSLSPNTAAGNPTPPSSSSSSSSSTSQQPQPQQQQPYQDQQNRGSTTKSLRHVLSRPSKQPQIDTSAGNNHGIMSGTGSDNKSNKQFIPLLSKSMSSTTSNAGLVFGVPLEEAVRVSRVSDGYPLPAIVFRCIEYLDAKNAILEEGLYRLSGSNATMQKLKKKFNQDGDVPLLNSKEEYDVHVVAGLLKMWLRELPITVLTRDFLHVIDLLDRKDRVNELGRLVSLLPIANYTLLRALTAHLIQVVRHSDVNKMTLRNLGIIFGPTTGIPGTIFNLLLSEFDYIFWTTEDGDAAPRRFENDEDEENDNDNEGMTSDNDEHDHVATATGVDENGNNNETEPNNGITASKVSLATENPVDSGRCQQTSVATDQQQCQTELLAPISSVVVPRRVNKKLTPVQNNQGRNNRNSILYIDAAPNAIVNLEKHTTGGTNATEDEEEIDELVMYIAVNDDIT